MVDMQESPDSPVLRLLNANKRLENIMAQMSPPQEEVVMIPVADNRQLRAKFYYPPELRKEEFIEFPLILHV